MISLAVLGLLTFHTACALDWSSPKEATSLDGAAPAEDAQMSQADGRAEVEADAAHPDTGAAATCSGDDDCDDGMACTGTERCVDGACQPGEGGTLDDGVSCTVDACDEASGQVVHTPDSTRCDDQRACNGAETCDALLGCRPGAPSPDGDLDQDGFRFNDGDCDDCEPLINPGAMELPGNTVDENCDQAIDAAAVTCDEGLFLNSQDARDATRTLGICKDAESVRWGLVSAQFVLPNGLPRGDNAFHLGHGILSGFGTNNAAREGEKLLVLSSGTARQPSDTGYVAPTGVGLDKGYESSLPAAFPSSLSVCSGVTFGKAHDGIAIELKVRVPTNTDRMAFDFAFFSADWPNYICSPFNDAFAVLLNGTTNMVVDGRGDMLSVNSPMIQACGCTGGPPCTWNPYNFTCSRGAAPLFGTGFDMGAPTGFYHAGTGWMTAEVPVTPGSLLSLRATVFDREDGKSDSTALLDSLRFFKAKDGDSLTGPRVTPAP
jgi:hypothetical protein